MDKIRYTPLYRKIVMLLTLVLLCVPAFAQDATAEPTNQDIEIVSTSPAVEAETGSGDVNIFTGESPENDNAASEETPPVNSVPLPVVIGMSILFGLLFIGLLYNQQVIVKIVGQLIPAEAVPALIESVMPTITDAVMNNLATAIPGDVDDKLFIEAAKQRGLTIVKDSVTGLYHTTRTPPQSPTLP